MVRNLTRDDFLEDGSLPLLTGQAALIVMDNKGITGGIDPLICSIIGDEAEVELMLRLFRRDPADYRIKFLKARTEPGTIPGVFDENDFLDYINRRFYDESTTYRISLKAGDNLESYLICLYALLDSGKLENCELAVINRNPSEPKPGYLMAEDTYALVYGGRHPVGSFEEFVETYHDNQVGATLMATMPIDGKDVLFKYIIEPQPDGEPILTLTVFDAVGKQGDMYIDKFLATIATFGED